MQTYQISIAGQVQGVGFRPFIFNLAHQHGLNGQVSNNANGVLILINGESEAVMGFVENILKEAPEVAIIQSHRVDRVSYIEFEDFTISSSAKTTKISIPLTADFVICDSCSEEIGDKANRRFQYPFTTCTQCGPRYSITENFPFERSHTAMSDFEMCPDCESEYINPSDMRFHSQTNSCSQCGPLMQLLDSEGTELEIEQEGIIAKTAEMLSGGAIVAIKNTNGYLLCVDANNSDAVVRLRNRKHRPAKPFALLYPSLDNIKRDFELSDSEANALVSTAGPIVILRPREGRGKITAGNVAPGMGNYGVMLPSSALLRLLMDQLQIPIVATSGNIHGSPVLSTNSEVLEKLDSVADFFLQHDLNISFPQDDSVMKFAGEQRVTIRRSRGVAPNFLGYQTNSDEAVMAMGAHLKSTLAFVPNTITYVSPYFGNLDNYEVLQRVTDTVEKYTELFETVPSVVLVDKHPNYQSTQLGLELAAEWNAGCIRIQHHKAHFASVLAENDLFEHKEDILGVIWDGTGLGDDGMIWGGEFFSYHAGEIARKAHFEYYDWLAGDKMSKEPRLSLLSLLSEEYYGEVRPRFSDMEWKLYCKLKANNTLKTSSVGRLFDAVACLLAIKDKSTFEGEAAMLLESCASRNRQEPLIDLLEENELEKIPTHSIIERLIALKGQGAENSFLAASFIHTLAWVIVKMAKKYDCRIVACSGGVFQNAFLLEELIKLCSFNNISLRFNNELSSNDENIALGQLAYYENIKS